MFRHIVYRIAPSERLFVRSYCKPATPVPDSGIDLSKAEMVALLHVFAGFAGAVRGSINGGVEMSGNARRRGESPSMQAFDGTMGFFGGGIFGAVTGATFSIWAPFYGFFYMMSSEPKQNATK